MNWVNGSERTRRLFAGGRRYADVTVGTHRYTYRTDGGPEEVSAAEVEVGDHAGVRAAVSVWDEEGVSLARAVNEGEAPAGVLADWLEENSGTDRVFLNRRSKHGLPRSVELVAKRLRQADAVA